jgi:CheY-specific phosphatase CheX
MAHGQSWELCVCVQDKLGDMLAANLLGTESETGEARAAATDAVGELANILAGALAVDLFGKDVVCQIGIPMVATETGRAASDRLAKATCRANLLTEEGYALAVTLTAQGAA